MINKEIKCGKYRVQLYGGRPVHINELEIDDVLRAKSIALQFLDLRESFNQIVISLLAFDRYLISTSMDWFYQRELDWASFGKVRSWSNLHARTYLNSITAFKDQSPKFKELSDSFCFRAMLKQLWQKSEADCPEFAFLRLARDYAQHHKLPIDMISNPNSWDDDRDLSTSKISVFIKNSEILSSKKEKRIVDHDYINSIGIKSDAILLFKVGLSIIGGVYNKCVEEIKMHVISASSIIKLFYDKIQSEDNWLAVISEESNENEEIQIFKDFLDKIDKALKFRAFENYEKHTFNNVPQGHIAAK